MWSFFQLGQPDVSGHSRQATAVLEQPLLTSQELRDLYTQATQLDYSATPDHALYSRQAGWMPSRPLGSGMDYAESRVYQSGDDPRSINWRLSARSQETLVKTYHTESRPELCILLDRSRSMVFGTRTRLKVAQAMRLATMLAYAAEIRQLELNALIIDDAIHWVDHQDIAAFITQANKPCILDAKGLKNQWKTALREIHQHLPTGSLVYLISDFIDLDESDQAMLSQLQASYYVQALHIMDKAELSIPRMGEVRLQAMDKPEVYKLKSQIEKERETFNTYATNQATIIKELITALGIAYSRVLTDVEDIHQHVIMPLDHS